ncbi:DUF2291 family protein [Carnimonas nigrificans]|uniref:DUF2291 family protein n=1 Tax=Carnimonas nigrificans TaxID=64323 RepID=UPI0004AF303F|nr:DUF2291 domain-containing protein [Carnimonas nigrificans]
MNMTVAPSTIKAPRKGRARWIIGACAVVVLGAIALDTKVVKDGEDPSQAAVESFGTTEFPGIAQDVEQRAVEAPELAKAVLTDSTAAGKQYGVGDFAPVIPVHFVGTAEDVRSGIYTIKAQDMPDQIKIRVQTGPAINGTDLRDATGKIQFSQFTNQIDYQNAGASLNQAMKAEILDKVDTANLTGKTVEITGVFKLINPNNWLVTPVRMSVQ